MTTHPGQMQGKVATHFVQAHHQSATRQDPTTKYFPRLSPRRRRPVREAGFSAMLAEKWRKSAENSPIPGDRAAPVRRAGFLQGGPGSSRSAGLRPTRKCQAAPRFPCWCDCRPQAPILRAAFQSAAAIISSQLNGLSALPCGKTLDPPSRMHNCRNVDAVVYACNSRESWRSVIRPAEGGLRVPAPGMDQRGHGGAPGSASLCRHDKACGSDRGEWRDWQRYAGRAAATA